MNELLLQHGAGNLAISLLLALLAWAAHRWLRCFALAHLLWLLVLVKLVTPPLFTVPLLPAATAATGAATAGPAGDDSFAPAAASLDIAAILALLWLAGSAVVLVWSLVRIARFHRLLAISSRPAPAPVDRLARELARTLRLATTPAIRLTTARVSPMVWWLGGEVRVYLPADLPERLDATALRWVLAHELAHVKRRDHLVRWLEWLACVAFWWNPVAWWARRNLRAAEEVCCDATVLRTFRAPPRTYANSLLTVVEFLAAPALRPPAMASEIDSGGYLERRLRMIVGNTPVVATPRWLRAVALLFTIALMPLGIACAQEPDVGAVGVRIREAVRAGELTPEQGRAMMRALREQGGSDEKKVRAEAKAKDRKAKAEKADAKKARAMDKKARARQDKERKAKAKKAEKAKKAKAAKEAKRAKDGKERKVKVKARPGISDRADRVDIDVARRRLAEARERLDRAGATDPARAEELQRRLEEVRARIERTRADRADAERRREVGRERDTERRRRVIRQRADERRVRAAERRQRATDRDVDWTEVRQKLEAAVEAGKLSPKDARSKLVEMRKEMAAKRKATRERVEPRGRRVIR